MANLPQAYKESFDRNFASLLSEPEGLEGRLRALGMNTSIMDHQRLQDHNHIVTPVFQSRYAKGQTLINHGVYYTMNGRNVQLWFIMQVLYKLDDPYEPFLDKTESYTVDLIGRKEYDKTSRLGPLSSTVKIYEAKKEPPSDQHAGHNSIMATFCMTILSRDADEYRNFCAKPVRDLYFTFIMTPVSTCAGVPS